MVIDDMQHIRELRLQQVLKSKNTLTKSKSVRNFLANDYYNINNMYETKITCSYDLVNLFFIVDIADLFFKEEKSILPLNLAVIPFHMQAIECSVKLIT